MSYKSKLLIWFASLMVVSKIYQGVQSQLELNLIYLRFAGDVLSTLESPRYLLTETLEESEQIILRSSLSEQQKGRLLARQLQASIWLEENNQEDLLDTLMNLSVPNYLEQWLVREGKQAEEVGDREKAEAMYGKATILFPNSWYSHFWLGIFYGNERAEDKYQTLKTAITNMNPQTPEAFAVMTHWHLGSVLSIAPQLAPNKKWSDEMRAVIEVDPHNSLNSWFTASAYFYLGDEALQLGSLAEAQQFFEHSLNTATHAGAISTAYRGLGDVQRGEGNLASALEKYQKAVDSNPNSLVARLALAETLSALGQDNAAVTQLQKVLELDPTHKVACKKLSVLGKDCLTQ
ncbi:MAG: tetratricopeptide repeat protein [Ardenticatenaceae bacterium]